MTDASEASPDRLRKSKLAVALGISRVTLDAYLNRTEPPPPSPDDDMAYSLEEVANYIASIKAAPEKKGEAFYKAEKVRLQCEEIAFKLQVLRGKFITVDEVGRTIIPLISELRELMVKEFELVNPARYKGRDQVECAEINRKSVDLVISRYRQGVKAFTEGQAAA